MVVEEEVDSVKDETSKDNPTNKTSTIVKILEIHEERSVDGGAIMLDQADRTIQLSTDIVENSATMR